MMADEVDEPDDVDDSPQFLLLTKARDALYLTLDRIRGDRHHVSKIFLTFRKS